MKASLDEVGVIHNQAGGTITFPFMFHHPAESAEYPVCQVAPVDIAGIEHTVELVFPRNGEASKRTHGILAGIFHVKEWEQCEQLQLVR